MQGKEDDGVLINVPFLVDHHSDKHGSCDLEKPRGIDHLCTTGETSFFNTTFNCLNVLSGVGILSVPYALSCGGWLSLILLLVIASVTLYTGFLIKRCMEGDPNIRSYPEIGHEAFGATGRVIVSFFMNLELYLVATGFLILVGDHLHNLLPNVELKIYGVAISGKQCFVLVVALVIMPTVWINNLTTLSYVSATGVVASVIILGSVLWTGACDDYIEFHQKGELLRWKGLPTAVSLYAFCYCAHMVFPTLYTSMRDQRQFSWVLYASFLFSTLTYTSMAILGYLMFGSEQESQITLKLPTNRLSSKVAIYTALINPLAKYAIYLKPVGDAIEGNFQNLCQKRFYRVLLRSILLGSSVFVAITLPFFGSLMALVGAFLSVTASILLPCLCYLKISGAYRKLGFESVFICFILLMGLLILVIGTYTSLMEIIHHM